MPPNFSAMPEIVYTPGFLRQYKKLEDDLKEEVKEEIQLFAKDTKKKSLKTHRLKDKLKKYWSFSVNYKYRIVCEYDSKSVVALLSVGDHDVYK